MLVGLGVSAGGQGKVNTDVQGKLENALQGEQMVLLQKMEVLSS